MSEKVASAARNWAGRNFNPGVTEQCMAFVRHVLQETKHALRDAVTKQPVDGLETSYYLASSLAGRDLGQLVSRVADLQPGSVVFFQNTYGEWPAGTITHVGIYVGGGQMVHRPTAARPVEMADLSPGSYWAGLFRCALLLKDVSDLTPPAAAPNPPDRLKVYAHSGRVSVLHDGKAVGSGQVVIIDVHDGKVGVRVNGQAIRLTSLALELVYEEGK